MGEGNIAVAIEKSDKLFFNSVHFFEEKNGFDSDADGTISLPARISIRSKRISALCDVRAGIN